MYLRQIITAPLKAQIMKRIVNMKLHNTCPPTRIGLLKGIISKTNNLINQLLKVL